MARLRDVRESIEHIESEFEYIVEEVKALEVDGDGDIDKSDLERYVNDVKKSIENAFSELDDLIDGIENISNEIKEVTE